MRPLEIIIEGLRSFREPVKLDLRGRDQIAIVGDTGSGKSSIIEAITYALYGQPTFSGPNREELMNDTSSTLHVSMRFQVSGGEWEIRRTLSRRSSGALGSPSVQLRRFNENNEVVEMVEQVRQVNQRIESIIGLNRDAFLRTTVLPQGRFAQLLVTDNPAERSNILRQVWRAEDLDQAGEFAALSCQEIAALRARLEYAASLYPEQPVKHLAELRHQAERAKDAAESAKTVEQETVDAVDTIRAAEEEMALVRGTSERILAFDVSARKAELEPIAVLAKEIEDRQELLREKQKDAAKRLSAIPSGDDGPSAVCVAAALTTLISIPQRIEEVAVSISDLGVKTAAAEDTQTAAEQARLESCRVTGILTDHDGLTPSLEQTLKDAYQNFNQIVELHAVALDKAWSMGTKQGELTDYERSLQQIVNELRVAVAETKRRTGEMARAEEHLATMRRVEMTAVVASNLHPGDKCPICRRALEKNWKEPGGADLHSIELVVQASRADLALARETEVALVTRKGAAIDAVEIASQFLRDAKDAAVKARETLALAIAFDETKPLPEVESLTAPLQGVVIAAEGAFAEHTERRKELVHVNSEQKLEVGIAAEVAASAAMLRAAADQSAADSMSRLQEAVSVVPEPYNPSLIMAFTAQELWERDIDNIKGLIVSAREREKVLLERSESCNRLTDLVRDLANEESRLFQKRSLEVDKPLNLIIQGLSKHRNLVLNNAIELCLEINLPEVTNAFRHQEVLIFINQLHEQTVNLVQVSRYRRERARSARAVARSKLQRISSRLTEFKEGGGSKSIVEGARATAESARYTFRAAQEKADRFERIVQHVVDLRELLAEVLDHERGITDLAASLREGGFPKWLTLRRSRNLLVHASRTMEQISGGRYAFLEPSDEFDRWRVLDRDSGQPRSPASLSGGEQFIASMALALGMVEMMTRTGGSLEAVFLDEGFGSLDRSNLDAAIEALDSVAASGKMVVLISHVHAVAEQVTNVAKVTRSPTGSSIRWLSDAERHELVETEVGSSALSGLLE